MTRLSLHLLPGPVRQVLLVGTALLIASCSSWQHSQEQVSPPPQAARPASHLAQMRFGPQAEFVLCTAPVCPKATPKTLAPPPTKSASQALSSLQAAATSETQAEEDFLALPPRSPEVPQPLMDPAPAPLSKAVTIHFRTGSATLSTADKSALDKAIAAAPDATSILISGRTDSTGSPRANERLAAARTRSVRHYLRTSHPHLAPVLILDPQGTCCYVEPNDTAGGRSLNRRVEVLFTREASTALTSVQPQPQSPTAFPRLHLPPTR